MVLKVALCYKHLSPTAKLEFEELMRKLNPPKFAADVVLEICITGITDADLKKRVVASRHFLNQVALEYDATGKNMDFFQLAEFKGSDDDIVIGYLSKSDLKKLYSSYFVPSDKPTRYVYERILSSSENNICPFCGFGHTKNLDHFLPKSKHPRFSVTPHNLVPACRDCNMDKLATTSSKKDEQCIHPYYDELFFFSEQWLFAEVRRTLPITLRFYSKVGVPAPAGALQRTSSHLRSFGLNLRFSVQAATELTAISKHLSTVPTLELRKQYLNEKEESYRSIHPNSWQTAMTQALKLDSWFLNDGYSSHLQKIVTDLKLMATPEYCLKCERDGAHYLPSGKVCEFHLDPATPESSIPPYKGVIPENARCKGDECVEKPTMIFKGNCYCFYHRFEAGI